MKESVRQLTDEVVHLSRKIIVRDNTQMHLCSAFTSQGRKIIQYRGREEGRCLREQGAVEGRKQDLSERRSCKQKFKRH